MWRKYYADQKTTIVSIHKKARVCTCDSSNREMMCEKECTAETDGFA